MRVLIVDDDPGTARLLCVLVERAGHQAVAVGDGTTGWRELTGLDRPDLLILDRVLPDMDGADLLARLRADERTREIPVLLLTAAARESADLADGRLTRLLPKPFDLPDFRAVLAELAPG
jgi:CheY-like chemotaxis protein